MISIIRKMKDNLIKNSILYLLVASFLLILIFTTGQYQLPQKSYGDIWAHLSIIQELKQDQSDIGDHYFDDSMRDPHYGPYFVLLAFISKVSTISFLKLSQFFGIYGVALLFISIMYAYSTFYPTRKKYLLDYIILLIVLLLMWESTKLSYAGYFSLADLAITITFPHIMTLAAFFFGVSRIKVLCESQYKNQSINAKFIQQYILLILVVLFILLNNTILGIAFLYSYAIFCLYYLVFKFKFKVTLLWMSNGIVFLTPLLLSLFWPYYSFFAIFNNMQTIHVKSPLVAIFEFNSWFEVAGIAFMGVIGFHKKNSKLLVIWFFSLAFIVASYLYPIRISSYWRFFPIMLIPLYLITTHWIAQLNYISRTFVLFTLVLFGFSSFINKVDTIGYRTPIQMNSFLFLSQIPQNTLLFSDPETSYLLSGLTSYPVVAVSEKHWNPNNYSKSQERYQFSLSFWDKDPQKTSIAVIEKYHIKYILINKKLYSNYSDYAIILGRFYTIKEVYSDDRYLLLNII